MEYIEQLIAKYLSGTISEEEIIVLRRWIDESPGRRDFIRTLESRNDLVKKYNRYAAVDAEGAKHRFLSYVRPTVFSPFSRRVWYYAAVLVPLVMLSVWLYEKETPDSPQFTLEQVDPGATQAILIMDNGTEMALTGQEEKTIALDDSVSAQMGNGAITYRPVAKNESRVPYDCRASRRRVSHYACRWNLRAYQCRIAIAISRNIFGQRTYGSTYGRGIFRSFSSGKYTVCRRSGKYARASIWHEIQHQCL